MTETKMWEAVRLLDGQTLTTVKGLPFAITVKGNELFVSRKNKSITRATVVEAYGVPAVFYQDRPARFNFKYEDWYQSTGRFDVKPCESVDACFEKKIDEPDTALINKMQERLLETFPLYLWGGMS